MRRTKIVATLGPVTGSAETIRQVIEAGMDVARMNMSHGTHAEHAARIALVRQEAARAGRAVAVMMDLQGPKIRTGPLRGDEPVELEAGQRFVLTSQRVAGDAKQVSTSYPHLAADVEPGDRILISDGLIEMRVERIDQGDVVGEIVQGGRLRPRQGVNLPGAALGMPSITAKDELDLAFGLAQGVDYVALSFVRRPEDVLQVKRLIAQSGQDTPVIAKLEKPQALAALEEILQVSDGVMVARGDLGVELSPEQVPVAQKEIIQAANQVALPVITATQMLESMIHNAQPTRAEASDVANAILDGSDAIMLSGETAIGDHPVGAVRMMARIAETVESAAGDSEALWACHWDGSGRGDTKGRDIPQAIGMAVDAIVDALDVRAVCVLTLTGSTARLVASRRPGVPILGCTPSTSTYHRLSLLNGVTPIMAAYAHTEAQYYRQVQELLLAGGHAQVGDLIIVTGGHPIVQGGPTNFLKVMTIESGGARGVTGHAT